ncbi:MAG: DUF4149 domain-containing protein [Planctomycetes bacterium]|nr:DUF4149 domain-containing protein [Planctomycetota bacterium]
MPLARIIHAITDLCLGTLVGVSVGTSVAASVIFGVSRQQGFDKHIANTLAGSMFDMLGWPVFALACVAMTGCLYSVLRPPLPATRKTGAGPWKVMAGLSVVVVVCALATQVYFAPAMKDLRQNSTWVNGELADPAEKAEFARMHGWSFGVAGLATLLCAGLLVGRRLVVGRGAGV